MGIPEAAFANRPSSIPTRSVSSPPPIASRSWRSPRRSVCRWAGLQRQSGTDHSSFIEPSAIELLTARPRTPLQIEQYLTRAFEETFRVGEKAVTAAVVEAVLSSMISSRGSPATAMT
jgi:hypothetical protein